MADLMDGEISKADDEIVIDRLYAENNEIAIGDTMKIRRPKIPRLQGWSHYQITVHYLKIIPI